MPNQDGKGPRGEGVKTGLQLGKCVGAKPAKAPPRRGLGRGRGGSPRGGGPRADNS
jgi:hypothetical protein